MKPVAADALGFFNAGDRVAGGDLGVGGVKRRVKTGKLRQVGRGGSHRVNRRETVRIVERRKRCAVGDFTTDFRGDAHRLGQFAPAVHNPVAHSGEPRRIKPVCRQCRQNRGEGLCVGGELAVAAGVCNAQTRLRSADPLCQTRNALGEIRIEDREFDRGRPCVEDQNIGGGGRAHSAAFAILRAARPAISVTT